MPLKRNIIFQKTFQKNQSAVEFGKIVYSSLNTLNLTFVPTITYIKIHFFDSEVLPRMDIIGFETKALVCNVM